MISLSALIVEDDQEAREVIKTGIEKYNTQVKDLHFSQIREANSFQSATAILQNEEITLVFLDLTLIGKKTGIDIIDMFPQLSYIIISSDEHAADKVLNNTSYAHVHAFRHKIEAIPNENHVVEAIIKFVDDKNLIGGFYTRALVMGKVQIKLKNIVIISKSSLAITNDNQIVPCKKCMSHSKDTIILSKNIMRTFTPEHKCLFNHPTVEYSITSIVEKARLNPRQFITISKGWIINLDYVKHLHKENFYVEIIDGTYLYTAILKGQKNVFDLHKDVLAERHLI